MSTTVTNYDGSIVSTPRNFRAPRERRTPSGDSAESRHVPEPGTRRGQQSLAHAVRLVARHDGEHEEPEPHHRDRPGGDDLHGPGRLEIVEAAKALREQNLQFMLNIEIGNLTLGAAACNQTKDALDGVEFGQVNSYVTAVKWVSPTGTLEEASEATSPELLAKVRGSYGLAGIVYEVTFRIKPLEIIRFNYHTHEVASLTQDEVERVIATNQAMVAWTIGGQVTLQTRNTADKLQDDWLADLRRFGWNFLAAFTARTIRTRPLGAPLTNIVEEIGTGHRARRSIASSARATGSRCTAPTRRSTTRRRRRPARYAFTFWAFPRDQWVKNLQDYVTFADGVLQDAWIPLQHAARLVFRQARHALPAVVHLGRRHHLARSDSRAQRARTRPRGTPFCVAFNEWAHARGGRPLLNQSPFITRAHVVAAYGERWKTLSDWIRASDPDGRLLNPFFKALLW